jgi:hypothetical protein
VPPLALTVVAGYSTPTVPFCNDAGEITYGAGLTVTDSVPV